MGFKAVHFTKVKVEKVEESGFKGVQVRWLITKEDDAKNFAMRCFEIEPGGQSASHTHGWEHEVFILNGRCFVACGDEGKEAGPGYAIFIPPNAPPLLQKSRKRNSEVPLPHSLQREMKTF